MGSHNKYTRSKTCVTGKEVEPALVSCFEIGRVDAHMVGPGCFQSSGAIPSSAPMPDMNLPSAGGSRPRSLGSRTVSPGRRPMPAICEPFPIDNSQCGKAIIVMQSLQRVSQHDTISQPRSSATHIVRKWQGPSIRQIVSQLIGLCHARALYAQLQRRAPEGVLMPATRAGSWRDPHWYDCC